MMNYSDYSEGYVCRKCGSILSAFLSSKDVDEDGEIEMMGNENLI